MNRASMLRLAALGIVGLGSALLIAALLLSTYTSGKIRKIPLNIDQTLTSAGTGTALDPASLSAGAEASDSDGRDDSAAARRATSAREAASSARTAASSRAWATASSSADGVGATETPGPEDDATGGAVGGANDEEESTAAAG